MIGKRSLRTLVKALGERQHYIALRGMWRAYPRFGENLWRYITATGTYPYNIEINTPTGKLQIKVYSHDDLLTVNEIFCREDYYVPLDVQVVVDLGSNIGISAAYFLTRNELSRCYLFEPVPQNVDRLRDNLSTFEKRYQLHQCAVSDCNGIVTFGIEPTGRYGGMKAVTHQHISVRCVAINDVLDDIFSKEAMVDILKIDVEGVETETVASIASRHLMKIKRLYFEGFPLSQVYPDIFEQRQYGNVCQLTNKFIGTKPSGLSP